MPWLSHEQIEYLKNDPSHVLYADMGAGKVVRGTIAHGDWSTILLRHEDG